MFYMFTLLLFYQQALEVDLEIGPYMEGQYIALEVHRIMVTFVYKWKVLVK